MDMALVYVLAGAFVGFLASEIRRLSKKGKHKEYEVNPEPPHKEYVALPCEITIDHLRLCDLATYGSKDEKWTEINIEGFGSFREREVQGINKFIETEIEVRMKEEPNDALRLSRFVAITGQGKSEALHARTCGLELKTASLGASGLWTVIFSAPSLEPSIVLHHT